MDYQEMIRGITEGVEFSLHISFTGPEPVSVIIQATNETTGVIVGGPTLKAALRNAAAAIEMLETIHSVNASATIH